DEVAQLILCLPDVALVLENRRKSLLNERLFEALHVEEQQRASPIQRLADRRDLLEVELADSLDGVHHLSGQLFLDTGNLQPDDAQLLLERRKVDVKVKAPALQRVRHLTRVVAGQHDSRDVLGADRPEFRDADLEIGEDLQQERLELRIRLVDLVDQEDGRSVRRDGLEQGSRQDEPIREENVFL